MSERTVENTGHQLAALRPGIFDTDIQVAEADTFVVGFDLHGSGTDAVVIFELQATTADTDTVEAFILVLVLVAHFQGGILLSILILSLDIGGDFKLA